MAFSLETERLTLRRFTPADAPYMLRQLNEPGFIANIADRGVRSVEQATAYLENGPITSYRLNGFGFWAVIEKAGGSVIGTPVPPVTRAPSQYATRYSGTIVNGFV